MGFIKFAEEKKWKTWKEQEEIILRNHGIEEAVIQELYEYDWHDFKRNRSFGEHQTVSDDLVHLLGCSLDTYEVTSMDTLLDQLSNVKLYYLLKDLDNLTQLIIYIKFSRLLYPAPGSSPGFSASWSVANIISAFNT